MDARHYDPKKISDLRQEAGLSQEALAESLGVHKLTIIRAEKGRSASYDLLVRLAERFNVAVTSFLYPHPTQEGDTASTGKREDEPATAAA